MSALNTYWTGRTVFLTGGSGFVGGWLVRELVESGARVVALVRQSSRPGTLGEDNLRDRVTLVNGSVEERTSIFEAIGDSQPEAVFHLAGQSLAGIASSDPLGTLETNVGGTWNLLEACRQLRVGCVVVASSDKAYGASSDLPFRETHPLRGTFPYDVSKSCVDLICSMYAKTYGLRVAIARCGNVFGGGDLNFSRLIPGLIRSTLQGNRFVIHSDGNFGRDFLFIKDAVGAYLTLAEHLDRTPALAGEGFNFSLGARVTVLEILEEALALMGMAQLRPMVQNRVSSEVRDSYMSCEKAQRMLGWAPRYSLKDGLSETIAWYRNFLAQEAPSPATMGAAG